MKRNTAPLFDISWATEPSLYPDLLLWAIPVCGSGSVLSSGISWVVYFNTCILYFWNVSSVSCCQVISYLDFVTQIVPSSAIFPFYTIPSMSHFLVLRFCRRTFSPSSNISFFPIVLSLALTLLSLSSLLSSTCFLQSTALFQLFGRFPLVPLPINGVIVDPSPPSSLQLMV